MNKLSEAQGRVLRRLRIGAYYPAGRDARTCGTLEKRGLVVGNSYGAYSLTDAGRAALEQD